MRLLHVVFLLVGILGANAGAQEKPRKKMVFPPGAKTPEASSSQENVPTAKVVPAEREPVRSGTPRPADTLPAVDMSAADAPDQMAQRFFSALQKADVDGAYDHLTRGSKIAERPEESKALRAKTREALDVFGVLIGYQMIESKNVGERLLRRTYVSLGKEFPLRWRFYFYKPELAWRLVDLRVDDRLSGIFEEPDDARPADAKP